MKWGLSVNILKHVLQPLNSLYVLTKQIKTKTDLRVHLQSKTTKTNIGQLTDELKFRDVGYTAKNTHTIAVNRWWVVVLKTGLQDASRAGRFACQDPYRAWIWVAGCLSSGHCWGEILHPIKVRVGPSVWHAEPEKVMWNEQNVISGDYGPTVCGCACHWHSWRDLSVCLSIHAI